MPKTAIRTGRNLRGLRDLERPGAALFSESWSPVCMCSIIGRTVRLLNVWHRLTTSPTLRDRRRPAAAMIEMESRD
jgi:hypothetical protein